MSTIHFKQTTTATPEQFIAGLTDFGPGRAQLFGESLERLRLSGAGRASDEAVPIHHRERHLDARGRGDLAVDERRAEKERLPLERIARLHRSREIASHRASNLGAASRAVNAALIPVEGAPSFRYIARRRAPLHFSVEHGHAFRSSWRAT